MCFALLQYLTFDHVTEDEVRLKNVLQSTDRDAEALQHVSLCYLIRCTRSFDQSSQEIMPDYIREIEEAIGQEPVQLIVKEAQNGKITIKTAEQLATELGRKDETVKGEFKRRNHSGSAVDGREVKQILSDWWNYGDGCNDDDPKKTLLRALKEVKLSALVSRISKLEDGPVDVSRAAWRQHGTTEENNNEINDSDRLLEDSVTITIEQTQTGNVCERSLSRERAWSNWQKLISEMKKMKTRRCKKRWAIPITLVAIFLPSFLFWYLKLGHSLHSEAEAITRSVRIGNSRNPSEKITELTVCPTNQSVIPDLPIALAGHVGLFIRDEDKILVCGGTNDQGYDSRMCMTFTLGAQHWADFDHIMNKPRNQAHAKINEGKIFIIGGIDSHPIKNCQESQDVFDLKNPEKNWKIEANLYSEDEVCFPSEVVLEIPCK